MQNKIQDALDDLVSTRSSMGRKTRALTALEHLMALVCAHKDTANDLDGFLCLQDSFECNIPSRLLLWISMSKWKLEGLASGGSTDHDRDSEIITLLSHLSQSLSIIQGVSLNHESSKRFLGRRCSLEVLLDLLLTCRNLFSPMPLTTTTINTPSSTWSRTLTDATSTPLPSTILDTLLCILVDSPSALRAFEECNGVQAVVKLLKTAGSPREVRMKCLEFLYFYLMDEPPSTSSNGGVAHPTTHDSSSPIKSQSRAPSSPSKKSTGPSSPTKTAPNTPIHIRAAHSTASLLKARSKSKPLAFGPQQLAPSSSLSSVFSTTWGSVSSFSSELSRSTSTTTPEPDDSLDATEAIPSVLKTPKRTLVPSVQNSASGDNRGRRPLCTPIILRKGIDIDYVPTSPTKPKAPRPDASGMSGMALKVRELRELNAGSRSMPNVSMATPTKSQSGTLRLYGDVLDTELEGYGKKVIFGQHRIRTGEEKREILSGLLGNVDALVEGVRKAGIWGLG